MWNEDSMGNQDSVFGALRYATKKYGLHDDIIEIIIEYNAYIMNISGDINHSKFNSGYNMRYVWTNCSSIFLISNSSDIYAKGKK